MQLVPLRSWVLLVLALLMAAPVPSTVSVSVSSNDPFRAIVVKYRALHPEPPLCCLKPLPSIDPPEEPGDILLSFEEWKEKQLRAHSRAPAQATPSLRVDPSEVDSAHQQRPPVDVHAPPREPSYPQDSVPPHFRVPITDRFNYANMDCSARVHMAHRSAKSPSSILSSKKDWYMLSPCSTKGGEAQFVVVELCDDIRIDTVQLANFEFFSGVFKDFTVRVAKTYPATDDGWTLAGTYRAKNVRGVQSFHPPTSLRDFYRYIRVDLHSHYGHEYYCPISLLRVYGLTHLEEWKWDVWEAESRARLQQQGSLIAEATPTHPTLFPLPASTDHNVNIDILNLDSMDTSAEVTTGSLLSTPPPTPNQKTDSSPNSQSQSVGMPPTSLSSTPLVVHDTVPPYTAGHLQVTQATPPSSPVDNTQPPVAGSSNEIPSVVLPGYMPVESPPIVHDSSSLLGDSTYPQAAPTDSNVQSSVVHTSIYSSIPVQTQSSGESIYRTIMNRLTVLEANHTLHARYVEEQTVGVRGMLKKLGEEVGRLESLGQIQGQMYQRTVQEWERQRLRLALEHSELLSQVNHLTHEIILEKRLGIAQLCLLLAVLVFMGFTRGASSVEYSQVGPNSSRRGWDKGSRSFGSSRDNRANSFGHSPVIRRLTTKDLGTTALDSSTMPPLPLLQRQSSPAAIRRRNTSRAATSASSVKRLASTAHLHEVKSLRDRRNDNSARRLSDQENIFQGEVFGVTAAPDKSGNPSRKLRRPFSLLSTPQSLQEETVDADTWIDTDNDGSEAGSEIAAHDST